MWLPQCSARCSSAICCLLLLLLVSTVISQEDREGLLPPEQLQKAFRLADVKDCATCVYKVEMLDQPPNIQPRQVMAVRCKCMGCKCDVVGDSGDYACNQLTANLTLYDVKSKRPYILNNIPYSCACIASKPGK